MKIGILQTGRVAEDLVERHGEYADMFEILLAGKGFEFDYWNVVNDNFPTSIKESDGWIVTGSRHSVYDGYDWIHRLEEFLRDCYRNCVPVVGVCFGHQILAQALGGKVEKFSGGWSVGRQRYEMEGHEFNLNTWHQDQVMEPPECAEVVGSSEFCQNAMLSYGNRALSIQPHPEFGDGFVEALIETRGVGVVPSGLLDRARESLGKSVDDQEFADRIGDFFWQSQKGSRIVPTNVDENTPGNANSEAVT